MKPTSIIFHNGCKFDISPMVVKSISTDGNAMRMVVDSISDTGSCVIPCTATVDDMVLTLNLINGDTVKVTGVKAQYEGDDK